MAEVNDIREIRAERNKKERKRFLMRLSIFAFIAIAVILVLVFFESIFGKSLLETLGMVEPPGGYPVSIVGTNPKEIHILGENVALLTDTEIRVFDSHGNQSLNQVHNSTNPHIQTAGSRAVVYDVGYYAYTVLEGGKVVAAKDSDHQILSAAIASNGNYALATTSTKFLTELTVYNKNNEQLAAWRTASNYIHAVAFSQDGRYVAAAALYSNDGLAQTTLQVLDLNNEKEPVYWEKTFQDASLISLSYLDNGNLCLVFDKAAQIFDPTGELLLQHEYVGELYYCNLNKYGAFVAEKQGDSITARLVYDAKKVSPAIPLPAQFKTEEHNGTSVRLLSGDTLSVYNRSFVLTDTTEDLPDAFGLACSNDRHYLLTFTEISKIK